MPGQDKKRRGHERIRVQPMYTAVTACRSSQDNDLRLEGHIYDISKGGIRIELDEALDPGEVVALHVELPGATSIVEASASVVWVHDEHDDPGPRRMALQFTGFPKNADRARSWKYQSHIRTLLEIDFPRNIALNKKMPGREAAASAPVGGVMRQPNSHRPGWGELLCG